MGRGPGRLAERPPADRAGPNSKGGQAGGFRALPAGEATAEERSAAQHPRSVRLFGASEFRAAASFSGREAAPADRVASEAITERMNRLLAELGKRGGS